eukprot:NODE_12760_length_1205_cov_7.275510.p1 GENE.NODE_12760_length_1205_cov_7.275510~~NODE_12760_length_1205_cov_7.275510.p1  ORF type:complete len:260 (+),score=47.26 NODE_12760_length_1205_cov_7.275510:135-914(+)
MNELQFLGVIATIDVAVMFACYVVAACLQTEMFYDTSAAVLQVGLMVLSLYMGGIGIEGMRRVVNTALVVVWATNLGFTLTLRIWRDGGDRRFITARKQPLVFLIYWLVQAGWIFIMPLPVHILNAQINMSPITWIDYASWAIWAFGFIVEVVADAQKRAFKADWHNSGCWIDTGLWHIVQHPNYAGEITLWWGLFLSCAAQFYGVELASVVSPLFITYLIVAVSGIPMLQQSGEERWGHIEEFREYKRVTKKLIPGIW